MNRATQQSNNLESLFGFQKSEILKFWEDNRNDPLSARNQILSSLCPQVYGLYVVKLAVALALAGGVQVRNKCH